MQHTQQTSSKIRRIILAATVLIFVAPIPALAYTTRQTYYSSSGSGYYSTLYGWVGQRTVRYSPVPKPITPPAERPAPPPPATGSITAEEMQLVNLVNQERAKAGLAPLTIEYQLVDIARIKSRDMIAANYFGHTSPNFGSTFNLVRQRGIPFTTGGENLAGAMDVATAHRMLMNSSGHRANILYPGFKRIGIGIVRGGPYGAMFTQLFLG